MLALKRVLIPSSLIIVALLTGCASLCRGRLTVGAVLKPWIARSVRIDVDRCQRVQSKEFAFWDRHRSEGAQSYDRNEC